MEAKYISEDILNDDMNAAQARVQDIKRKLASFGPEELQVELADADIESLVQHSLNPLLKELAAAVQIFNRDFMTISFDASKDNQVLPADRPFEVVLQDRHFQQRGGTVRYDVNLRGLKKAMHKNFSVFLRTEISFSPYNYSIYLNRSNQLAFCVTKAYHQPLATSDRMRIVTAVIDHITRDLEWMIQQIGQ